ncbi:MAG: penicillin-insensitive murein endopeptidase [Blastocatellia bacterium]
MRYEFEIEPFQSHTAFGGGFELFDTELPELADEWQEEISRSSPDYIRWVQSSLNQILGLRLAVDGVAGSQTRSAIRSFQQQRGLTVDGQVGPQTEAALIAAGASPPPKTTPSSGGFPAHPEVIAPLPRSGPGFYSHSPTEYQFGVPKTIQALMAVGAAWQQAHPHPQEPRIGIGDISRFGGGPMLTKPHRHKSHQKGVDVDISLVRNDGREKPVVYQAPQYSRPLTQELVDKIRANRILPVGLIYFNDPAVRGVQPYRGHDNHLHVRFSLPSADSEFAEEVFDTEMASAWQEEVARGSREYIRWAQSSLNQILGTRLAVDGISGPQTRSAIRSFQQRQGLAVDGVVGPRTEAALIAAGAGQPPGSGTAPAPPTPPLPPSPLPGGITPCPVTSPGPAKDRCLSPGTLRCPAIPDLLCVSNVGGIPFEYPTSIGRDASGLTVIRQRKAVTQKFIPSVGKALGSFMANSAGVGMPIEAILTYGSLYCRCISDTNTLSNHSFGDAIDIVGIRWRRANRTGETIVHNYSNAAERALLRRINACLRLSFATVIDYHRSDHRDHFHCDMNRGGGRNPRGKTTVPFVQEALNTVLGRSLPESGALDAATMRALGDFSGRSAAELQDTATLNRVLDELFTRVARG